VELVVVVVEVELLLVELKVETVEAVELVLLELVVDMVE